MVVTYQCKISNQINRNFDPHIRVWQWGNFEFLEPLYSGQKFCFSNLKFCFDNSQSCLYNCIYLYFHSFIQIHTCTNYFSICFLQRWMLALTLFVTLTSKKVALGLENGLARTPPMGWLAWERFRCNTGLLFLLYCSAYDSNFKS